MAQQLPSQTSTKSGPQSLPTRIGGVAVGVPEEQESSSKKDMHLISIVDCIVDGYLQFL